MVTYRSIDKELCDNIMAQPRFLQALMELILTQGYMSWHLPKGSIVICTENEAESGKYDVQEIDSAMRTRMMTITMGFDFDSWAQWAEKARIDSRCINFMMLNSTEIMGVKDDRVNARSLSMFFNSLRSINDLSRDENVKIIKRNGLAIGEELTNLFITFVYNHLDKLPTPKDMIENRKVNTDTKRLVIFEELDNLFNGSGRYRSDIAMVLAQRMINYTIMKAEEKDFDKKSMQQFEALLCDDKLFKPDVRLEVCKKVVGANANKFKVLLQNQQLRELMFPKL